MKYLVLAILLFACGAGLTQMRVEDEQAYVPVVRTRTAEGMFLTLLHERVTNRKICQQTVERFAGLLRTCATCTIESTECATTLAGIDKAIAEDRPVPLYTVAAEHVRISLVGPPSTIKSDCESIAGHMVLNGLKSAACIYPKRDPV
jgi:hypothetical protein